MIEFVNLADLTDPNDPAGRTYRQVNVAMQHRIPVGALVESEDGWRAFVSAHRRDCDQTPLYSLSLDPDDRHGMLHGYGEAGLEIIRQPNATP